MAAVPIYNYVYGIGKKFEYANYGFAIAIGKQTIDNCGDTSIKFMTP